MSAHKLFCMASHRLDVLAFLHDVNPHFDEEENLHVITCAADLTGYDHITFLRLTTQPVSNPEIWRTLIERGAIVIDIDDSREKLQALKLGNGK